MFLQVKKYSFISRNIFFQIKNIQCYPEIFFPNKKYSIISEKYFFKPKNIPLNEKIFL